MRKVIFTLLILLVPTTTVFAETEIETVIEDIIEWKKQEQGISNQSPLLQNPFLKQAGTTAGDWYPFALGRIGYSDDFEAYLATIEHTVKERYKREIKLDATKATEWHRISLAIAATGGDPTDVNGINLIADGTYNRAEISPLNLQGINGWIWGLITLDSMRYQIPEGAITSREEIIKGILSSQLPDGGFSFYHDTADADITAMVLQALAPYVNSFETFTYTEQATKKEVTKSIRTVVEEALLALSELQLETGDFGSWGEANAESTAQVLVALSALQIDPLNDQRFIKNGVTILDGLMSYRQEDGGFIHAKTYNADNPTSLPDESNSMASEQVLYALIAYKRWKEDVRSLYDLRPEMDNSIKGKIQKLEQQLLTKQLSKNQILNILKQYEDIPVQETMYIDHFETLQQAVKQLNIKYETKDFHQKMGQLKKGKGTITPLLSQEVDVEINVEMIENFIQKKKYSTTDYNSVLRFIRFLEEQDNEALLEELYLIQNRIEDLQAEIESVNEQILKHLYPISDITLEDRKLVEEIANRFNKIPKEDQQQIVNHEDLQQISAIIKSLERELWLKRGLIIMSCFLVILLVWRVWRKRKGANV